LQDEELIQPKYTIATVCLMVVYKADGLIRYDTIEEFNVDSKAEYSLCKNGKYAYGY